jgi:magnesium-transporting ATPase (P-type)
MVATTPPRPNARPPGSDAQRFANPLVMILLVASALSAATGDLASFMIVAGIVVLSVLLDFVQENRRRGD